MLPKHIITIENDADFSFALTTMLQQGGYQVTAFPHAEDIEKIIVAKADVFIIDERLPAINGHTLCMILKNKPEHKSTPVILISGIAELEQLALLCNADVFLGKPFSADQLYEAIGYVLK